MPPLPTELQGYEPCELLAALSPESIAELTRTLRAQYPTPPIPLDVVELFLQGAVLAREHHAANKPQPTEGTQVLGLFEGDIRGQCVQWVAPTRHEIEGELLNNTIENIKKPGRLEEYVHNDNEDYPSTVAEAADRIRDWSLAGVVLLRCTSL